MRTAAAQVTPGRSAQEVYAPMRWNLTTPQRFWSKVDKNGPVPAYAPHLGPCWLWIARLYRNGYGRFTIGGRPLLAHRWLYEQENGPIPTNLECDHLCRVRSCVRLSHIELVTRRENLLRGETVVARNTRVTHCPQGHPYDEENTYPIPSGGRGCRACRHQHSMKYQARKRAERRRARKGSIL